MCNLPRCTSTCHDSNCKPQGHGMPKGLIGPKEVQVCYWHPDRKNIFYEKVFRCGQDIDSIEGILRPIAKGLLKEKNNYPLTVIYISLKWCGFAYKLFEYVLGIKQYYPEGSLQIPENRLFVQFHASQTNQMKEQILRQVCSTTSTVRVVFATVAMGMGADVPSIRTVIHVGTPCSIKAYFQETGRAGRDGKPVHAILHFNNRDIAKTELVCKKTEFSAKVLTLVLEVYCLNLLIMTNHTC